MTRASHESFNNLLRHSIQLLKPPKREKLSESARRLLKVELNGAMVPWDGDLVPYMHEPMNCLQSRQYDGVALVGMARSAKTVSLVDAWVAHTVAADPADMLVTQISKEKAAEYSKKRLSRSFHASKEVRAALSPNAHDNNVHDIRLKAGHFLKIGWPSKTIFASSDWKRVALTDYDRMIQDVGGEGSPWILGGKRTTTFMSSGMVMAESSPGFEIIDPTRRLSSPHEAPPTKGIMAIYNEGDRRLYHWKCPDCGKWFEPDFHLFMYDEHEPDPTKASEEVLLACPHCGVMHNERQKHTFNQGGRWLAQGLHLDENDVLTGEARKSRIASFWQKGPTAAFQTWNQLVYKYLAAMQDFQRTGSMENLKATINTDQGKPFTPPINVERSADYFIQRQRDLGIKEVPASVRFLTAAIDVQAGKEARFEVKVIGWGAELTSVVLDYFIITDSRRKGATGETLRIDPAAYPEDWDVLDDVLTKSYPITELPGRHLPVRLVACDSGGKAGVTDNAYQYWRRLKKRQLHRKLFLVKGASHKNAPLQHKTHPDNRGRNDRKASARGDVPVLMLNTNRLKDILAGALSREVPGELYVEFPDWLDESYFDGLTSEVRDPSGKWSKISEHAANEPVDLFVYNIALAYKLGANKFNWSKPPPWAAPLTQNAQVFIPSSNPEENTQPPQPRRRRRR